MTYGTCVKAVPIALRLVPAGALVPVNVEVPNFKTNPDAKYVQPRLGTTLY